MLVFGSQSWTFSAFQDRVIGDGLTVSSEITKRPKMDLKKWKLGEKEQQTPNEWETSDESNICTAYCMKSFLRT